jgi:hypothetical protein
MLIVIISLSGCVKSGDFPSKEDKEEAKKIAVDYETQRINQAKNLVNNFIFVKNKESNLCFAYNDKAVFSAGHIFNIPILVQVPCENVEKLIK